ncbi:hypothetical protein PBV87_01080 [Niameybacter massiliensis]|uniref:Chorion class high-cysteine HCB protein 13 n=1 Tax=Holtiella tumoricola TaxID=3018743 RepID=A0AA42DJF5_9FIRM|nr:MULTISPECIES: hypothetical protein [Lachnospirales]MDA3730107.1 hypothetical protein [Holtiella tumoricola]
MCNNTWIWIIIAFFFFCCLDGCELIENLFSGNSCGCGCKNECGFGNYWWIIIAVLFFCCFNNGGLC